MNIVIIGAGEVGFHLADILSREEHRVAVVDTSPAKAQRITETLDAQVVVGDATRAEVLNTAGVPKADLVVAVTDRDLVNMVACVLSKHLGAKRLVLRLKDTGRLESYRYFYKQTFGFDVVFSTEELAAEEIAATVREENALEVETFAGGRVQLRRLRLERESEATSASLADLRLPAGVLVVAVARKDRFFVPTGADHLMVEDQVYVIGAGGALDAFERLAGAPQLGRRSVVIMGGGGIARGIVKQLEGYEHVSIRIIEQNPDRARALAAAHGGELMVLVGDATDLDLLLEERIGEANVFVATSGDDERNMVACQLARSLGVSRTVALVNKASYRQIYDLLGVDQAIAPRILCANRILRFVRSGSVSSIAVLGEGRAEVLELEAHFGDGKRSARKLKNLGLPRGTVVGALVRGETVLVPDGETVVEPLDHVIVFTLPENLDAVEHVFGRRHAAGHGDG